MIDRFGPLPKEVNTLMLIVRIKAMCKRAGISRLDAGPKGATVQFHNDKFANPAGLVDFIKAQGPAARIAGNKIVLMGEMKTEADRIKGAFNIARDLAEKIVKPGKEGSRSGHFQNRFRSMACPRALTRCQLWAEGGGRGGSGQGQAR